MAHMNWANQTREMRQVGFRASRVRYNPKLWRPVPCLCEGPCLAWPRKVAVFSWWVIRQGSWLLSNTAWPLNLRVSVSSFRKCGSWPNLSAASFQHQNTICASRYDGGEPREWKKENSFYPKSLTLASHSLHLKKWVLISAQLRSQFNDPPPLECEYPLPTHLVSKPCLLQLSEKSSAPLGTEKLFFFFRRSLAPPLLVAIPSATQEKLQS